MTARVFLHVGLPKTGTTYLQGVLAAHREQLRQAGYVYPFVRPGAMFRGAVELRGSHAKFGLPAEDVAGAWEQVCARALSVGGTAVISHEVLAGATPQQIARAVAPFAGAGLHVVITVRDLGRQAVAHWQEEVKLGDTRSFGDFERDQFRADTGRDAGPDDGGVRPHFWHVQDPVDTGQRWGHGLPPEHVHLVVAPPPGAPPDELWRRFCSAIGLDPGVADPGIVAAAPANRSLGPREVALLREVNRSVDGRLSRGAYLRLVKRELAETELAALAGSAPRCPADLGLVLSAATRGWVAEVRELGYLVHGDLDELEPVVAGPGEPHPDDVPEPESLVEEAAEVAARILAEAGRRDRVAADGSEPGSGPASALGRGVVDRARQALRRRRGR